MQKTYSYLTDDDSEDKKAKDTKKCVIKGKLKFKSYKNRLEANQVDNKINYLWKKYSCYERKPWRIHKKAIN